MTELKRLVIVTHTYISTVVDLQVGLGGCM